MRQLGRTDFDAAFNLGTSFQCSTHCCIRVNPGLSAPARRSRSRTTHVDDETGAALTPGPTKIRKCSVCSELFRQFIIASGNAIGATFWSDGKLEAPMLPEQPWLVRCPQCSALVWVDEQELVGVVPFGPNDGAFSEAKRYLTPTASDYEKMVPKWAHDRKKCRYLRQQAWWAANDDRRESANPTSFSEDEARNVDAFVELLDESNHNDRRFE